ncbi:hypothetical protein VE01_02820 [Pseudogymnoascus verrucosus]|uniref:Uncharacterized protein n=1 Tax=Pseudogymnoascus verrucosus TaxID=342668 RepID=A0A1B8GUJ7_9PEZI|nr:uncharacterized protein VE01_02820 [Pseudogymnoascus verrucosus]OBT99501.1 hypothetical protein VE01_02820 [Pseudogymnoascus verrucosus]
MESSVKMPKTPLAESIRGHRRMTSRSDSTHAPSKTLGEQSSKCPKPQPSVAGSRAHLPFTTASFWNLRHGLRDSNALLAPFQTRDFSALRWESPLASELNCQQRFRMHVAARQPEASCDACHTAVDNEPPVALL